MKTNHSAFPSFSSLFFMCLMTWIRRSTMIAAAGRSAFYLIDLKLIVIISQDLDIAPFGYSF
jgi:hypothetical protein